jgi:glyoxylase-like metal-dependent hydrolase (beta-lactamase superfamily II)
MATTYEVLALRYGSHTERTARHNFIIADPHDAPMPLDYFVWAIRGGGRTIVVDTGFSQTLAAQRGRTVTASPDEVLRQAGIEAREVADVVVTHLHYDHAGNLGLFPKARFHIQDAEMAFCTGRCICHPYFRAAMESDHVVDMVRLLYDGRLAFHDGDEEIAPGISLHLIGGHAGGLQAVRVPTARGYVVLASDATHFWANIRTGMPFPLVVDMVKMLEGYRKLEALADGPDHIIPGHDPLVRTRFPAHPASEEIVRLDLDPIA